MSANINLHGGLGQPIITPLATSNLTDITMAFKEHTTIATIALANTSTSSVDVTINLNSGSDVAIWIGSVAAKTTPTVEFPVLVGKGRKLTAIASTGGSINVTCTPLQSSVNQGVL